MSLRTFAVSTLLLLSMPFAQAAETKAPAVPAKPAASAPAAARVNVNTADVAMLTALKGVGEKKAQAIVAYRKAHGPFNSLEQFEAVPGIGPSIIAKNKSVIVFH